MTDQENRESMRRIEARKSMERATASVDRMVMPGRELRVCYNCKHWRKKEYIHCINSGPWGGDITGDPKCTFENKWTFQHRNKQ